ncbi:MAG: glycosyltransferase [Proteobacteria bacterium]|nr:glycosyltransferase [Pseudomonadota bacterium]
MVLNNKVVITVAVVTYNSALTIVETLNSIASQSYGAESIELIISDDSSLDDTIKVVSAWLNEYGHKFKKIHLIENVINGGIAKNCNSVWKAATSKWIKTIAGDDVLFVDCLSDNYQYVCEHPNAKLVFSSMQLFKVNTEGNAQLIGKMPDAYSLPFFNLNSADQFKFLQSQSVHGAPSAFINKLLLEEIGFADERFPLMEDYPLWFKITKQGYKIHFLDKDTVYYRISDSVSNSVTRLINDNFIFEMYLINKLVICPSLSWHQAITKFRILSWPLMMLFVSKIFKNKRNKVSVLFLYISLIIRPGSLQYVRRKLKI